MQSLRETGGFFHMQQLPNLSDVTPTPTPQKVAQFISHFCTYFVSPT
jgi:hypothetical protein